jgi:hypothetical protein
MSALSVPAALGATAAPAIAATAPAGSIGIRLLDAPVAEVNDPRARLYIVDHVAPGAVIERHVEVSNSTPSGLRVALYAAGATIESGSFIGADGRTANALSSWTAVSPATPTIAAGGTANATVSIAVPANVPAGEQYAIVWAEVRTPAGTDGGVIEVNRVGVRIYLSVGAGAGPAESFTIDSLTAQRSAQGNPMVVASVHNTGGRALDISGTLQLSAGPGGLSAGPFPAALGVTVAVGASEPITITLNEVVPTGPWLAHLTLRSGATERSAQARIIFPVAGASAPVTTAAAHPRSHDAVVALTIVMTLLALAGAGVALRRRASTTGKPA